MHLLIHNLYTCMYKTKEFNCDMYGHFCANFIDLWGPYFLLWLFCILTSTTWFFIFCLASVRCFCSKTVYDNFVSVFYFIQCILVHKFCLFLKIHCNIFILLTHLMIYIFRLSETYMYLSHFSHITFRIYNFLKCFKVCV